MKELYVTRKGFEEYKQKQKTGLETVTLIHITEVLKQPCALLLAHLSHWLMVIYCDHWMCVVSRQQLLQRTSRSTGWNFTKFGRNVSSVYGPLK